MTSNDMNHGGNAGSNNNAGNTGGNSNEFDLTDATAAYALGALSVEETQQFETQLGESEETRNEVTEMTETAALLGLAVEPVVPSAGLKANIMGLLSSTPQLPRLDAENAIQDAPTLTPARELPDETAFEDATFEDAPPTRSETVAHERWFRRPMTILVAAAAAVALIVGGGAITSIVGDAQFQQAQGSQLAAINAAADVQRASTPAANGGDITLVWSGELGLSALIVDGLPELPSSQTYQLWYIDAAGPVGAGTFDVRAAGTTWRVLEGTMSAGDTVGVTVEPRGGSEQPTSDPIAAIPTA